MEKDDTSRMWDILVAGALLTRLPLPHAPQAAFDHQARATWAYPLAGLAVGLIAALVGWLALALGLPHMIAAGLMLAAMILSTGAMHEDGLADTADGFWGGFDPARRLEIMKDSHIGTYGVLALVLGVGLRWTALAATLEAGLGPVIAAAVMSRGLLPTVMRLVPHARAFGLSHSVGRPDTNAASLSFCTGFLLCFMLVGWSFVPGLLLAAVAVAGLCWLAKSKIGGQTGDVLGAAQQLAELAILVSLIP